MHFTFLITFGDGSQRVFPGVSNISRVWPSTSFSFDWLRVRPDEEEPLVVAESFPFSDIVKLEAFVAA